MGASGIAAAAATGATDFPDPVTRVVTGFTDDFFDGSATARGVTTVDAAAGVTLGTGAGAIVDVLDATSAAASRRSGCPSKPAAPGAGRRGNATAATTSTAAAPTMSARSRVARSKGGGGFTVEGVRTERAGSTEDATGTRAFSPRGFARRRFLTAFFARAPLFAPASANTSNVQRMLRPARSGRIRFAMALDTAMHVPVVFRQSFSIADEAVTNRSLDFHLCGPPVPLSAAQRRAKSSASFTGVICGSRRRRRSGACSLAHPRRTPGATRGSIERRLARCQCRCHLPVE